MKRYIIPFCQSELNLRTTLLNGQCFNWFEHTPNTFSGVLLSRYFEIRRLDPKHIQVSVQPDLENLEPHLQKYFYKGVNLKNIYEEWIKRDHRFSQLAQKLPGTRILKQDPWECTISFICSSNNNIARITGLLSSLKNKFGRKITQKKVNGETVAFHQFPSLKQLSKATQQDLKSMGFGYRANFIVDSVKAISQNGGQEWVRGLQHTTYEQAKQKLMTLKGIGRKVADCICLFSLGCHSSVPIDTHMFQIAKKLGYIKEEQAKKSMSQTLYKKIAKSYQDVYGQYAGWAQQIIFTGDLASYKDVVGGKTMSEEEPYKEAAKIKKRKQ